jgi:lipid kinase YegS
MRSLLLILNGKHAAKDEVREAVAHIREFGYLLDVRVTWEQGDAARYADESCRNDFDVVIAGGGDGTVNEVVNGIFRNKLTPRIGMAVLPLGTANDFASSCGIPNNPYHALKLAATGDLTAIDVARANDQFFINVASGGFGAEVTATTPNQLKSKLGAAAYLLKGFAMFLQMSSRRSSIRTANGVKEESIVLGAVGNGQQAGGGFRVTPRALLNDGLLDVMLLREFNTADLNTVLEVMSELRNPDSPGNQYVFYMQVPWLEVERKDDQLRHLNLDGEPALTNQRMRFEILHQPLRFVLPTSAQHLLE